MSLYSRAAKVMRPALCSDTAMDLLQEADATIATKDAEIVELRSWFERARDDAVTMRAALYLFLNACNYSTTARMYVTTEDDVKNARKALMRAGEVSNSHVAAIVRLPRLLHQIRTSQSLAKTPDDFGQLIVLADDMLKALDSSWPALSQESA